MKRIYKYGLASLLAVTFTACGGGGGGSASFEESPRQAMLFTVGESVEVRKSDTVTPLTDDTQINVLHSIEDDIKVVTVLSGEISYLQGDYTLAQ